MKSLKKADRLVLIIEKPAYGGLYISRYAGKVVMVKGAALPGETIEISIDEEKKDYFMASVVKTIEPSPHRIRPECRFFGLCGGCHLQHTIYINQVKMKEDILMDSLKRLGGIDIELSEPLTGENSWKYRQRGQFKVSGERVGFFRRNSTDLVEIDSCPLMKGEINLYLEKAEGLIEGFKVKEMHISYGEAPVALIKTSMLTETVDDIEKMASIFIDSGFSGLIIETDGKEILVYGKPYVNLNLEGLKYTVSARSFFQSNWELNQRLVKLIKDALLPLKGKKVLDLFAGAGNFSLPLAEYAEVTAVEGNPFAIEDGRRNLKINRIAGYSFINSSAEDFQTKKKFDILILDPPRLGLTKRLVNNLLAMVPEQIVYISCNPATFARDLRKLKRRYSIESVRLVDLFPQTFHIESLAFLRIKA